MTTLTTRERDRRGIRYFYAALAVVMLGVLVWLHRDVAPGREYVVWVPAVAGFAWGFVLWYFSARASTKWLPNIAMAGLVVIFLILLGVKVVSPFAWMLAVFAGACAVAAALPVKAAASNVAKVPVEQVQPWRRGDIIAATAVQPYGRRTRAAVGITIGSATTRFLVSELAAFFDGETAIAETANGQPLMFLTRTGVASRGSVIGDATAGIPDGTLIIHAAADESRPAAVFTADDASSFEQWVRSIPED